MLSYQEPPVSRSATGEERRVGLELELAGIDVRTLAALVAEHLDGTCHGDDLTQMKIEDTRYGSFRVELDARSIKDRAYIESIEKLGVEDEQVLETLQSAVITVASELVPVEIVTPPIPVSALGELDPLWAAVRARGGLGTSTALRYAFGLHLNPEVPAPMSADTILRYLRAYFLLEDWLVDQEQVDWTRRMIPFINPFPEEYRRLVLDPSYVPDMDSLIDDYLSYSPTRNRIMDLLPLFSHVRPDCLEGREIEGGELVGARPTFHYRLPNCEIDRESWTPAMSWNNWVKVEELANDSDRRDRMADIYRSLWDLPWRLQRHGWIRQVQQAWL